MNRLLLSVFCLSLTLAGLAPVSAQDGGWPRTVALGQGMVTIYSPQVDELNDDIIQYRAALAYRATPGAEPVFGAGWFESPVSIDTKNRIVQPFGLNLTEIRFPEGTGDIRSELAMVLAQQSPAWNLDFSLDELDTALQTAEAETRAVNTTPPKIIYRDHPALLISIDGEPVLREVENSPYKAVINTPYPLLYDGKHYHLNAARNVWYRSRNVAGPYQFEPDPPEAVAAMVNPDDEATAEAQPTEKITAANAPEIVVSTEPAELIVTEGPAAFVPLVDDLLVLQNSDDDVFMHVSSQKFYIVLAGRWYQADSLTGPWTFQPSDKLPGAFANIPRDSAQADSRVYVAGTEEANDAVLDAQVPQTAAVKRGEVDIEVKYDGQPVYQPVDGTDLVYIQNTGSTVLVSGGLYYLVEEGVWYVSSSPNGPWQVSDHRPAQVDTILPTSPVYNTKYVHVYDSTPSVVYVGYTPGYLGSIVYRDTIFYGTGWYYRPWVSPYYYYPRFSTWGFHVSYNSWYGWSFGLGWGWGPFSVSYYSGGYWHRPHRWYHRHYGRWGPGRYRHGHHRNRHDRYAHNRHRGGGRDRYDDPRYDNSRDRGGNARPRGNRDNYNLYRDESQRAGIANTRDRRAGPPERYANNTRRVNYTAANGGQVRSNGNKNRSERNRAGPVSPSELRTKARVRDVNLDSNRSMLLADNNGRVYSKAGRKSNRKSKLGGVGSTEKPTNMASVRPSKTGNTSNRTSRQPSRADMTGNHRSQKKAVDNRQARSTKGVKTSRQSNSYTTGKVTKQRSAAQAKTPKRSPQTGKTVNSTRQQPRVVSAPAQQTRQVTSRKNPGNNKPRQTAGRVSAPVQKQGKMQRQGKTRQVAAPQNTRNNGARNSAPRQKGSRNYSNQQRNSSKSFGGGRRESGRRAGKD